METKLIAILGALVLAVGAIGTVYMQSAFALSQTGSATATDSSTNSQTATNTATATSTGSGNLNGNGNDPGNNGNNNGNTAAFAESDQDISHETTAAVGQSASCDNTGNTGVSGNTC